MVYKKNERRMPTCLECGSKIRYGRSDKKFCSEDCRCRHFNTMARSGRAIRRRVLRQLAMNHDILEELMRSDVGSIDLIDLMGRGYVPAYVTSYRKNGKHDEYSCFDIKFIMTRTRVYSISKIQNV